MDLPTPSPDHSGIFEQMGQLFIDTFEELEAALDAAPKSKDGVEYSANVKTKKLVDFQMRYTAIVKEYQEQIFRQPAPLDEE